MSITQTGKALTYCRSIKSNLKALKGYFRDLEQVKAKLDIFAGVKSHSQQSKIGIGCKCTTNITGYKRSQHLLLPTHSNHHYALSTVNSQ